MTMTMTLINLLFPFLLPLLFRLLKIHHLLVPLSHLTIVLIIVMESTILPISVTHPGISANFNPQRRRVRLNYQLPGLGTSPKTFVHQLTTNDATKKRKFISAAKSTKKTISKAVTVTTPKKIQRVQNRSPHISDNENDNQQHSFIVIAIPAGSTISVVLPSASLHSELVSLLASDAASRYGFVYFS